ncbi:alpha/beta hydrolase fold domain-containing protein [Nocardia sp. NPDC050712]|uniref:alpha/beta hydrolase fold domain-containing protein n=1 Tax=Nocardia sp. NPDC050712 TaxID=3155518 RepID=UPI0033FD714D
MPLDATIVRALTELGIPLPEPSSDPHEQRRRAIGFEQAIFPHLGLPGDAVRTSEHLVAVAGYPDVLVRLYYPDATATEHPVCLFFFGGGFSQGGLHHPAVDAQCARRAAESGVVVAAVSYALAPEHPFPAALEQGSAVLDWLIREAGALGLDPARVALWGQSAGGNLAAALALLNRERAQHHLALQILEVPFLDLTDDPAERDLSEAPEAELAALAMILRWYLPDGTDRRNPLVSPLRAKDFAGLPPAYILTAECDPIRRDGADYAAALADAGVPVSAIQLLGLPHGGALFERVSLTARTAGAVVVAALRTLHG